MLRQTEKIKKTRLNKQSKKEQNAAYLFIALPLIGFLIFTVISTSYSFYSSFFKFNDFTGESTFVGFDNYVKVFKEEGFVDAIINTVLLLASIPVGITIGLLLAIYLKKLAHGSKLLSLLYYLPAVTSAVAVNLVWRYIFNYESGVINKLFGLEINWFSSINFWTIKVAIVFRAIWGGIGGTMILYLAGLNNIPQDYYESSSIDGASKIQQLIHITIPLVNPTTFYLLVTSIIGGLQSYADAQIFAQGNKQAQTIVYYIWTYGINKKNSYGVASAASVCLAVSICILTIIQFKRSKMLDI